MINILLVLNLVVSLLFFASLLASAWFIYHFWLSTKETALDYFLPVDDKTPSKFAVTVDAMSARAGYQIAMQIKTTLMGKASGESKAESAIEQAILEDGVASQSPIAGLLLSSFPKLGRLIKKHPEYIDLAMPFINNLSKNKGNGSQAVTSQPKFKL